MMSKNGAILGSKMAFEALSEDEYEYE